MIIHILKNPIVVKGNKFYFYCDIYTPLLNNVCETNNDTTAITRQDNSFLNTQKYWSHCYAAARSQ
jgi:hypothetical protein